MSDLPEAKDFPCLISEKVRYSDTDRQSHVNNVVFAVFFEAGRVELLFNYGDVLAEDCSFVLARSEIDFLKELNWPGHVTIGTRIHRLGRSSISIEQALFQGDQCAARSLSVMVQKHGETGTSTTLSDAARSLFERFSRSPDS
jgi:acyl-CoA thioester hydrolase